MTCILTLHIFKKRMAPVKIKMLNTSTLLQARKSSRPELYNIESKGITTLLLWKSSISGYRLSSISHSKMLVSCLNTFVAAIQVKLLQNARSHLSSASELWEEPSTAPIERCFSHWRKLMIVWTVGKAGSSNIEQWTTNWSYHTYVLVLLSLGIRCKSPSGIRFACWRSSISWIRRSSIKCFSGKKNRVMSRKRRCFFCQRVQEIATS